MYCVSCITDFKLLQMPLTNQPYHILYHNYSQKTFNKARGGGVGIVGKSITPTVLNLMMIRIHQQIDNIHSPHADRRFCMVKIPYIFQYLIFMKCFTFIFGSIFYFGK